MERKGYFQRSNVAILNIRTEVLRMLMNKMQISGRVTKIVGNYAYVVGKNGNVDIYNLNFYRIDKTA